MGKGSAAVLNSIYKAKLHVLGILTPVRVGESIHLTYFPKKLSLKPSGLVIYCLDLSLGWSNMVLLWWHCIDDKPARNQIFLPVDKN